MDTDLDKTQESQETYGKQEEALRGSARYSLSTGSFVMKEAIYTLRKSKKMKGPHNTFLSRGSKGKIMGYLISVPEDGKDKKMILIGKGTDLYKGSVVIAQSMLYYGVEKNIPLIGGLKFPDNEIEFYLFHPIWIFDGNYESLVKFTYLLSFPFSIGERWNFLNEKIVSVMTKLEKRYERSRKMDTYEENQEVRTLFDFFPKDSKESKESTGDKED